MENAVIAQNFAIPAADFGASILAPVRLFEDLPTELRAVAVGAQIQAESEMARIVRSAFEFRVDLAPVQRTISELRKCEDVASADSGCDCGGCLTKFVRNDLNLWRTDPFDQERIIYSARMALNTTDWNEIDCTHSPLRTIRKCTERIYHQERPTEFVPNYVATGSPGFRKIGKVEMRGLESFEHKIATITLDQACMLANLKNPTDRKILEAFFAGRAETWREIKWLFHLSFNQTENARKRIEYHLPQIEAELVRGVRTPAGNTYSGYDLGAYRDWIRRWRNN